MRRAVLAALPLAEVDLAQVGDHLRLQAGRGHQRLGGLRACAAAASRTAPAAARRASRSATARACSRPSGASGGSPWPSTSSKVSPGSRAAEAPWRITISSVASGGTANAPLAVGLVHGGASYCERVKVSRAGADVWYKYALEAMTARPNTPSTALAAPTRYGFSYRAWRFS